MWSPEPHSWFQVCDSRENSREPSQVGDIQTPGRPLELSSHWGRTVTGRERSSGQTLLGRKTREIEYNFPLFRLVWGRSHYGMNNLLCQIQVSKPLCSGFCIDMLIQEAQKTTSWVSLLPEHLWRRLCAV